MTISPLVGRRSRRGVSLLLAVLTLMTLGASPASAQSVVDPDLDSDGDGIVNAFDPDDDNDGVTDDIDPAPFDPSIPGSPGAAPPPSSISPDADSDGDGIANSHDPDDDNDGWVDASDPVVFSSDNTVPGSSAESPGTSGSGTTGGGSVSGSVSGSGSTSARTTTPPGGATSHQGGVRISALPNTGTGDDGHAGRGFAPWMMPALMALALAACALTIASIACPLAVRRQRTMVMRR